MKLPFRKSKARDAARVYLSLIHNARPYSVWFLYQQNRNRRSWLRGNKPNQWDGVPKEVLEQYGLKYDDRTLEISVKFDA
jgi:hypothetical protein